jgi:hypothetical protein
MSRLISNTPTIARPYFTIGRNDCWNNEGPDCFFSQNWATEEEAHVQRDLLNDIHEKGYLKNPNNVEFERLKSDVAHAYAEAKKYVPDFPWDETRQTASQAVYACGTSYQGVSDACDEWRILFIHFAPHSHSALIEMIKNDPKAYDSLIKELEEKYKNK